MTNTAYFSQLFNFGD